MAWQWAACGRPRRCGKAPESGRVNTTLALRPALTPLLTARPVPLPYRVPESEVAFSAIRAQGPGGQHVNKAATAVHLRFDIHASAMPDTVKARLLGSLDSRISSEGVLVIKAQGSRSLESNKAEALARLQEVVAQACEVPRPRKPTRPTFGSRQRRLEGKAQRSAIKTGRGKVVL